MDWLKLLGWKSLCKAPHQKHLCVNTNASVCTVIEPDWQNYRRPPSGSNASRAASWFATVLASLILFAGQERKRIWWVKRDIYLHERSQHALKYHRFFSQCVCSTAHTQKSQLKAIMAFLLAATRGRAAPSPYIAGTQMSPVLSSKGTPTHPQTLES